MHWTDAYQHQRLPRPADNADASALTSTVTLQHRWDRPAEREALMVVAHALADVGLYWAPEAAGGTQMIKMHGQEIRAAAAHGPALADLASLPALQLRRSHVFPCVLDPMLRGDACHGIPMGVHRSNCLWVNQEVAEEPVPRHFNDWVCWLERCHRRSPYPLAVGDERWQLGLLFEAVLLARCGPAFHRQALALGSAPALGSQTMLDVLRSFASLRRFVSERSLGSPWSGLADDVRTGRACALVMGDWARKEFHRWGASQVDAVVECRVPGTEGLHLFNVDYFVPLRNERNQQVLEPLVSRLMDPAVQAAYNWAKGSLPAVCDVNEAVTDADGWRLLQASNSIPGVMVPSFSFDHACCAARRDALTEVLAGTFIGRWTPEAAISLLIERCAASVMAQPMR